MRLSRLAFASLVFFPLFASGCVALALGAAGGAAGVTYVKGRLIDTVDAPVSRVHAAAMETLESKGLVIEKNRLDLASAELTSEYADGKDVWIDIKAVTSQVTEIRIRVGISGDQDRSISLMDGIKSRL